MRHIIALMLAVSTITLQAEPEIKGTPTELGKYLQPQPDTLTLTGEGRIQIQADRAIVRILVSTESKSLTDALQKNEALRRHLTQSLTGTGVPSDRILSSKFASTPEQSNWTDKVKNYRISHQMKVTIENGQQFNAIATMVDQNPDMRVQDVQPDHSAKDEQSAKATTEAFKQLEKKKAVYEQSLGQKLIVKTAREITSQAPPEPTESGMLTGGLRYSSAKIPASAAGVPMEATATGFFGELSYRVVVSVDYFVGSKPKVIFP